MTRNFPFEVFLKRLSSILMIDESNEFVIHQDKRIKGHFQIRHLFIGLKITLD